MLRVCCSHQAAEFPAVHPALPNTALHTTLPNAYNGGNSHKRSQTHTKAVHTTLPNAADHAMLQPARPANVD
eukprot:354334-Chlamydomonas_euryale.AAC.2